MISVNVLQIGLELVYKKFTPKVIVVSFRLMPWGNFYAIHHG